jgi:hypothetical protein
VHHFHGQIDFAGFQKLSDRAAADDHAAVNYFLASRSHGCPHRVGFGNDAGRPKAQAVKLFRHNSLG